MLKKTELIGIEPLQDIIELTLWTSYVKYHKPTSLIVLGKAGKGKTEIMKKYRGNNGVHSRQRFSAFGMQQDILEKRIPLLFEKPKILGHVVIYDFHDILTFKTETVGNTIQFLCALTEEGLSPQSTYAIRSENLGRFKGARGGLIAGINTAGMFNAQGKVKGLLTKGGFLDRPILWSYNESALLTEKILVSIKKEEYRPDKKFVNLVCLKFPRKRKDVEISREYMDELGEIVSDATEEINESLRTDSDGKRLLKNLTVLAKASALRDGRTKVERKDIDRIRFLSRWMNLKMRNFHPKYKFYEGD